MNGIRPQVTILKWIGQDFPKLRHAMRGKAQAMHGTKIIEIEQIIAELQDLIFCRR